MGKTYLCRGKRMTMPGQKSLRWFRRSSGSESPLAPDPFRGCPQPCFLAGAIVSTLDTQNQGVTASGNRVLRQAELVVAQPVTTKEAVRTTRPRLVRRSKRTPARSVRPSLFITPLQGLHTTGWFTWSPRSLEL